METYPSYVAIVDTAKLMEMGEIEEKLAQRKKEQGFEGRPSSYGGPSGGSYPLNWEQSALSSPSASAQSPASAPKSNLEFKRGQSSSFYESS